MRNKNRPVRPKQSFILQLPAETFHLKLAADGAFHPISELRDAKQNKKKAAYGVFQQPRRTY